MGVLPHSERLTCAMDTGVLPCSDRLTRAMDTGVLPCSDRLTCAMDMGVLPCSDRLTCATDMRVLPCSDRLTCAMDIGVFKFNTCAVQQDWRTVQIYRNTLSRFFEIFNKLNLLSQKRSKQEICKCYFTIMYGIWQSLYQTIIPCKFYIEWFSPSSHIPTLTFFNGMRAHTNSTLLYLAFFKFFRLSYSLTDWNYVLYFKLTQKSCKKNFFCEENFM